MSILQSMDRDNRGGKNGNIEHTIVFMSGKGGVGKSTIAGNLAFSLSEKGANVGLLEVKYGGPDIIRILDCMNNNITRKDDLLLPDIVSPRLRIMSLCFPFSSKDLPVKWRGTMLGGFVRRFFGQDDWGKLDYLIIDLPAGTGDVPLTITQNISRIDGAILVTTAEKMAHFDLKTAVGFSRVAGIPIIGLIENKSGISCPHCRNLINMSGTGEGEESARKMGVPFLGRIPIDPTIIPTGDENLSMIGRSSDQEVTNSYHEIMEKIECYMDQGGKQHEDCS